MRNVFVTIVIANFNGENFLEDCLDSVFASTFTNYELIIVDDGSTDSSLKIIDKYKLKDKRIDLIKNDKNLGAAASRNKAIKVAHGEIVVFLDNDTVTDKHWIEFILDTFHESKNVGAVQALILDFKNRDSIQMAGGKLIPETAWLVPFNQWQSYKKINKNLKVREIVAISAALAVKREVLEKVGGFDEKEAVTTEDLDFCWRIWLSGYKILLSPKALVYHYTRSVEERSFMRVNYRKIYFHLAKNSFRSILKNYELLNSILYLLTSLLVNFGRGFYMIVSKKSISPLLGSLDGLFWNIINIGDTLSERKKIQRNRKVSDKNLRKLMFVNNGISQMYNIYKREYR